MGRVHNEVKTLCGERVDHRVKSLVAAFLMLSLTIFAMKIGILLNVVGFSKSLRMDFLNEDEVNTGFLTDFSEFFVFYLNKGIRVGNLDTELGIFLGTHDGKLSLGVDTFVDLIKHDLIIFGLSGFFGKSFLSVGPMIEIDI